MIRETKPTHKSARDVALGALTDVIRHDAYAAQALDRQLLNARLSPDDRRLAASLFYCAVENRLRIEWTLKRFFTTPPVPAVEDILHIAAAQLMFMDKLPDHAVVDEAVKQTRAQGMEGLTRMVNGVLRNLIRARDGGEIVLPDKEADPIAYLSVTYSLSPALAKALADAYGFEEAERIAAYVPERRAQSIRPNFGRISSDRFEAFLERQKLVWEKGTVADAFIVRDAGNIARLPEYRDGLFSIQGESAMLAAQAVQAKPGMQILDACAAPGGKTCMMAEKMAGSGRVYAWDLHEHRVGLIRAAVNRLGLDNVRPAVKDARVFTESMEFGMDAVLVDAPCSGLGVMAEKPDIKYKTNEAALGALVPLQKQILDTCARYVCVGGLLVYATCTILPDENQNQVRAFLETHPQFVPDTDNSWLPEKLRGNYQDGMIQILPDRDCLDGFFIARLRRKS